MAHSRNNFKILSKIRRNRYKIDTPNTDIHDLSFSWLSTGTSIKSGRKKLVLCAQAFPLSEMMWLCKCFPVVI